ncbi:MAG: ABC transporter permease [Gemmatimonadetes bacterium]|nr:ABC transporter permease [Gemmatimonadota bacterium]
MSKRRIGGGMGFFTTITEGIAVAFDSLGSNKVRSGLTILGVTIGVFVVMVMAAVITGINKSFSEVMASNGVTTFYVAHFDFTTMNISGPGSEDEDDFFKNPPLEPRHTRELARLPEIENVSAIADLASNGYTASVGGDRLEIALYAVGPDYLEIDAGDIIDGRWFTVAEAERRAEVTIVDSATAYDLFGGLDPIGRDIRIGRRSQGASFKIIGIYRKPDNLFAGLESHWVWIPFSTGDKVLPIWDRMISFIVRPEPGVELERAKDAVTAGLRRLRGVGPGEPDNFAIMTQDQMMDMWGRLTGVLFIAMVGLSSVGLMVGGVGVIGIMMISVTERTREIGLRKSMGARRRDIMWQFLVEASTLTLVGGSAGLIIGSLLVWGVNQWTPLPATVPMWSIIAALAASALTGIGFGLYPASKAAGLEPVDALRHE